LIKNCQVKRGMLLLNRSNVKVLGGDVPELYGGNMINELEMRFKQKLGMIEEPSTSVPDEHTGNENLVDEIEEFGDDEIDYDALDMVESTCVQAYVPQETIHQLSDDDDDFMATPPMPRPSISSSTLSLSKKRSQQQTQQHTSSPSPPSQKRTRTDDECSSMEISKSKEEIMINTQDDNAELSWMDSSTWDAVEINKDDHMELDQDQKAHCSFETLLKTLKDAEQGNSTENIADIVTVQVRFTKLAKFRMSRKAGIYLEGVIGDPVDIDMETIKVIFTSEVSIFLSCTI
jgi:hypothetical protein